MNSQLQLQGPGEKLQVVQVEKPVPEAGEVVIKLKVVALNPVDWKRRYVSARSYPHLMLSSVVVCLRFGDCRTLTVKLVKLAP